jgi:pyridoxine/pyridoxamine 5'-phosphate oxidase
VADIGDAELLAYMRSHRVAVVSSLGPDGSPQSALVGVATTDDFQIVFDTVASSRKHANLLRDGRAAVTFSGPGEKTLQFEGQAFAVECTGPRDKAFREAYYLAWPDGRDRLHWAGLSYWRVKMRWLRFTDYDHGPLIVERRVD